MDKIKSDGSTASYYQLPPGASQLQHLISHKDMNAQIGEIFRECYRYGESEHSDKLRGAKKIKFYIEAEIERLEKGVPVDDVEFILTSTHLKRCASMETLESKDCDCGLINHAPDDDIPF